MKRGWVREQGALWVQHDGTCCPEYSLDSPENLKTVFQDGFKFEMRDWVAIFRYDMLVWECFHSEIAHHFIVKHPKSTDCYFFHQINHHSKTYTWSTSSPAYQWSLGSGTLPLGNTLRCNLTWLGQLATAAPVAVVRQFLHSCRIPCHGITTCDLLPPSPWTLLVRRRQGRLQMVIMDSQDTALAASTRTGDYVPLIQCHYNFDQVLNEWTLTRISCSLWISIFRQVK